MNKQRIVLLVSFALILVLVFSSVWFITIQSSDIHALADQKTQLETWLSGNITQISTLESETRGFQNQMSYLKNQTLSQNAQIAALKGNVSSLNAQIQNFTSLMTFIQNSVNLTNDQKRDSVIYYVNSTALSRFTDLWNLIWTKGNTTLSSTTGIETYQSTAPRAWYFTMTYKPIQNPKYTITMIENYTYTVPGRGEVWMYNLWQGTWQNYRIIQTYFTGSNGGPGPIIPGSPA